MAKIQNELPFIYDSITVEFSIYIFFKQLLIHLLYPFLNFTTNITAQQLNLPRDFFSFCLFISPFFCYLMVISYSLHDGADSGLYLLNDGADSGSSKGALWIPLIAFILHKCFVAIKYAHLHDSEYARFIGETNEEVLDAYRSQLEFVRGWLGKNEALMEFEFAAAAMRCGVNIANMAIVIPNPANDPDASKQVRCCENLLNSQKGAMLEQQSDGSYEMNAYAAGMKLIRLAQESDEVDFSVFSYGSWIVAILITVIPFLELGANRDKINVWQIIFFVTSSFLNLFYVTTCFKFMSCAIFDIIRQRKIIEAMSALIRITDFADESHLDFSFKDSFATNFNLGSLLPKSFASDQQLPDHNTDPHSRLLSSDTMNPFAKFAGVLPTPQPLAIDVGSEVALGNDQHQRGTDPGSSNFASHAKVKGIAVKGSDMRSRSSSAAEFGTAPYIRQISAVIEQTAQSIGATAEEAHLPRLSFDYPQNIVAWTYMRLMLQTFGKRVRVRLNIFIACMLGGFAVLLAVAVALLIQQQGSGFGKSVYFLQSLSIATAALFGVVWFADGAAAANDALAEHTDLISAHMLRNQRERAELLAMRKKISKAPKGTRRRRDSDDDSDVTDGNVGNNSFVAQAALAALDEKLADLEEVAGCLEKCLRSIEIGNSAHPFTIMGIEAQSGITTSIISFAISVYSVIISALMGDITAQNVLQSG